MSELRCSVPHDLFSFPGHRRARPIFAKLLSTQLLNKGVFFSDIKEQSLRL